MFAEFLANQVTFYLFKVNNRNTKKCDRCSKVTIKTPEQHHGRRSGVFIVEFEYILRIFVVFLLITLNKKILDRAPLFLALNTCSTSVQCL